LGSFCIVQVATVILYTNMSLTPKPGLMTFFPCHQRIMYLQSNKVRVPTPPGKSWIFFLKTTGPGKSWKITLLLESPGN